MNSRSMDGNASVACVTQVAADSASTGLPGAADCMRISCRAAAAGRRCQLTVPASGALRSRIASQYPPAPEPVLRYVVGSHWLADEWGRTLTTWDKNQPDKIKPLFHRHKT